MALPRPACFWSFNTAFHPLYLPLHSAGHSLNEEYFLFLVGPCEEDSSLSSTASLGRGWGSEEGAVGGLYGGEGGPLEEG